MGRFRLHYGRDRDDWYFHGICRMVPIHVQEKGTCSLDRPMGEARGISQAGLRSSRVHTGIGLGFGQSSAAVLARTDRLGPDSCRASSSTAIDLRLSRIGASQGRLNLSLAGFPELERQRGFSLHCTESKVVCTLVPSVPPVSGHVLPH